MFSRGGGRCVGRRFHFRSDRAAPGKRPCGQRPTSVEHLLSPPAFDVVAYGPRRVASLRPCTFICGRNHGSSCFSTSVASSSGVHAPGWSAARGSFFVGGSTSSAWCDEAGRRRHVLFRNFCSFVLRCPCAGMERCSWQFSCRRQHFLGQFFLDRGRCAAGRPCGFQRCLSFEPRRGRGFRFAVLHRHGVAQRQHLSFSTARHEMNDGRSLGLVGEGTESYGFTA